MASDLTGDRMNDPLRRRVWPDDYNGSEDDHGVRCPKCNCPRIRVGYTRPAYGKRIKRKRICMHCGHGWLTFEK